MLDGEHVDYSIFYFGSSYTLCARELLGFSWEHNQTKISNDLISR
jgi:hypothetical protein